VEAHDDEIVSGFTVLQKHEPAGERIPVEYIVALNLLPGDENLMYFDIPNELGIPNQRDALSVV
jgi:hypothetical protein